MNFKDYNYIIPGWIDGRFKKLTMDHGPWTMGIWCKIKDKGKKLAIELADGKACRGWPAFADC